ncbi:MAG: UDP-N-acetylmuramoyl-L-alanyl-D-glutamate--2,6-diaminopimelate ligase [Parvularculaceae bacterium]
MKLSELAGEALQSDPDIKGLATDSREVREGFLFAALPGGKFDGGAFIPQAEKNGAAAVLAAPGAPTSLPTIRDVVPRRRLAHVAALYYARQPATIVGVTGTNGKTSTVRFSAQLWRKLGRGAGSIGTIGAEAPGFARRLLHTTPEPVVLHETLRDMSDAGVTHVAMEVSSHALTQHRADGVRFAGAAFTNITQDHLDFHAGFEDYFNAKLRLFGDLVSEGGFAAVNADGEGSARVIDAVRGRKLRLLTTGAGGETLRLETCEPQPKGLSIVVVANGERRTLSLPLIGAFQAENALLAAAVVIGSGEDIQRVLPLLASLEGVPGRMQFAAEARGSGIYIDYAHTPDAVTTALRAIRPHAAGRVIVILGAGGDRDRGKRPLMGSAAAALADIVIVTDDNPRTEEPAEIRAEVLKGADGAVEIGDRREAIRKGVAMLDRGDILLIAGKGHETGQIVGDSILPFDDAAEARAAAEERRIT